MRDDITVFGHSVLQQGPHNDRVYLMKFDRRDHPWIARGVKDLARQERRSKVLAKLPERWCPEFEGHGFVREAVIPDYYPDGQACCFMAWYLSEKRKVIPPGQEARISAVLKAAGDPGQPALERISGARVKLLGPDHCRELAGLYAGVFESRPFPIHDPAYLEKTMTETTDYFGVFKRQRIVAASSAEKDGYYGSVEMTDFATASDFRGNSLAGLLLTAMEKKLVEDGFSTSFSIVRSTSYAMNITVSRAGYAFGGILPNNTHISGSIQSMNVWFKMLQPA